MKYLPVQQSWKEYRQAQFYCLARNSLKSPKGERPGGGKQNWSHCGEEEVTLFLLWQEMQTNVLPDHLLSRERNTLWPLPYEHFSSTELVNMFFYSKHPFVPAKTGDSTPKKEVGFLVYFISYHFFDGDLFH